MFAEGAILGLIYSTTGLKDDEHLGTSIGLWIDINPDALLLIFLPGLLFGDALQVNYHLFKKSCLQTLWLAFPGMLLGTVLTALVPIYVFQYDWSFNLAMTFGSILAATDPVAVVTLLDEVGAPARLRMLIVGESMLNDGAAIVFFTIFRSLYFFEATGGSIGRDFTVAEGFGVFFQQSLGGAAIGIAWGCVLILVFRTFNRKFDREDTIMQVTVAITVAYLAFYVADEVAETSGVLSVVFCGIIAAAFGVPKIHDITTLSNVWEAIEHLGNTLLFALGGVVWGNIVSQGALLRELNVFTASDWGLLLALYVFVMLIRSVMVLVSYPVISNVGLKTNFREAGFMVWGGLRGSVGIALALALDNIVVELPDTDPNKQELRRETVKVFIFVGGITLLTLGVNGTSSAWVLKKLGLISVSEVKRETFEAVKRHIRTMLVHKYVQLTSDERFKCADMNMIRSNVETLRDAREDIENAKRCVQVKKETQPQQDLAIINLLATHEEFEEFANDNNNRPTTPTNVAVQEPKTDGEKTESKGAEDEAAESEAKEAGKYQTMSPEQEKKLDRLRMDRWKAALGSMIVKRELREKDKAKALKEQREIFLDLLRAAYWEQIRRGELYYKFSVYALLQSLDMAKEQVSNGAELNDWESVRTVSNSLEAKAEGFFTALLQCLIPEPALFKVQERRMKIFVAVAFIHAHRVAQEEYKLSFMLEGIGDIVEKVLEESQKQVRLASAELRGATEKELRTVISHVVAAILLNYEASVIGNLKEEGILDDMEAQELLHDVSLQVTRMKFRVCKKIIKYDPLSKLHSLRYSKIKQNRKRTEHHSTAKELHKQSDLEAGKSSSKVNKSVSKS